MLTRQPGSPTGPARTPSSIGAVAGEPTPRRHARESGEERRPHIIGYGHDLADYDRRMEALEELREEARDEEL